MIISCVNLNNIIDISIYSDVVYSHVVPSEPNRGEVTPTQFLNYMITAVDNGSQANRKIGIFFVIHRLIRVRI